MNRRLEPMDRVRELGDASVPFRFDTHALFFSEDAVALETALHQKLGHRRLNLVNPRREFFYATPAEVKDLLIAMGDDVLEYNDTAEAIERRASDPDRRAGTHPGGGRSDDRSRSRLHRALHPGRPRRPCDPTSPKRSNGRTERSSVR